MTRDPLPEAMVELVRAINLLHEAGLLLPSMMMAFASIDIFAALARPSGKVENDNADFGAWVDRYLLPGSKLACTTEDLWAARCGLLHTYTPDARSVRKGKAAKMLYARGVLEESARASLQFRVGGYVILISQDLFNAMSNAMQRFTDDLKVDASLAARATARAAELFVSVGPDLKPVSNRGRTRPPT